MTEHPGIYVKRVYMDPIGMSPGRVAKLSKVSRARIERVVRGQTPMTPDTALRLGRLFVGLTGHDLMIMQVKFDLAAARHDIGDELVKISKLEKR